MLRLRSLAFPTPLFVALVGCATGQDNPTGSGTMSTTMAVTDTEPTTTQTTSTTDETTTTTTTGEPTTSSGTDSDTDSDTDTDTDTGGEMVDLDAPKLRIYQLSVRLFSNTKTLNISNGDLDTNGVGKFDEINETALAELRSMGFSHIWLHGVLQQASATAYDLIQEPASDPDVLQGKAGAYDGIKDYFDVSADYAADPAARLDEFEALVARAHEAGLKVVIDFVPNHVSRVYHTNIPGKLDLGLADMTGAFLAQNNNYYYLVEPPDQALTLPTPDWWTPPGMPDGTIEDENNDGMPAGDVPRATANNVTSVTPSLSDWYHAVKLNYGYDFVNMMGAYDPMPKTWLDMDKILQYWQDLGVDGFRVDHADHVPAEFWSYAIANAKSRDPEVTFFGESYAGDPLAIPGNDAAALLAAGFTAVTDDVAYDTVKSIFCCGGWANDLTTHLDGVAAVNHQLIRYSETHLDRRIASPMVANMTVDDSGFGSAKAGEPVSALLYLLSQGPIQVYNGQEVGEPGSGAEGFGREDGRTTIYDYWAMPELAKWVNDHAYDGGQLSAEKKGLRAYYQELLHISTSPSFAAGELVSLQEANKEGDTYCSKGRWCYAFLRHDDTEAHLVLVNLNPNNTYKPRLIVPPDALAAIGMDGERSLLLSDRLDEAGGPVIADVAELTTTGVQISLAPSQARVFRVMPGGR